jgi:hypothetical protein
MKSLLLNCCIFYSLIVVGCVNQGGAPPPVRLPVMTEVTAEFSVTFVRQAGTTQYIADVPDGYSYKAPVGGNCNRTSNAKLLYDLFTPDDYIDFVVTDLQGVDPGNLNQKVYVLIAQNNGFETHRYTLSMEQGSGQFVKLYTERWRFKLNAQPSIEIGNGETAPADSLPPFERAWVPSTNAIGQKWTLIAPADIVPTSITASIFYKLRKSGVQRCP